MLGNAPPVERSTSRSERINAVDFDVATLVKCAAEGDHEAWNALVDRYTGLLWSVASAHRLAAPDAADVVQTTWLRLVEKLDQIRQPDRLPAWLVTTARRECLRVLGLAKREEVGAADDLAANLPDEREGPPETAMLLDERNAILWHCFRQLSERCQTVLRILMASPAPSYADVSDALDIPVGSIGPTRGRCLDRLRELARAAGLGSGDTQLGMAGR
jgi:RNA polymerase sigma factor (sigma-70 family)